MTNKERRRNLTFIARADKNRLHIMRKEGYQTFAGFRMVPYATVHADGKFESWNERPLWKMLVDSVINAPRDQRKQTIRGIRRLRQQEA